MKMDAKLDMLQRAAMLGKGAPQPQQPEELDDIMEIDEIENSLVSTRLRSMRHYLTENSHATSDGGGH